MEDVEGKCSGRMERGQEPITGERHLSAITQLLKSASLELALPLAGIRGIVKSSN